MQRILMALLAVVAAQTAFGEEYLADHPYSEEECIECHQRASTLLVDDHRQGRHGSTGVGCSDCHGSTHSGALERSRTNRICTQCHTGAELVSFETSKHGVILKLEESRWDLSTPFVTSTVRTPGCAYCHLYAGDHAMKPRADGDPLLCGRCHSSRYLKTLATSGAAMEEIGTMKVVEAKGLLKSRGKRVPQGEQKKLLDSLNKHRQNLHLGVVHQSPDFQWWHGQPALDGDLIRIRSKIVEYIKSSN